MSYTCPNCNAVSHNAMDEEQRYCANCNLYESDMEVLLPTRPLPEPTPPVLPPMGEVKE